MGEAAGLTVVVLAGGRATRLRPLSDSRPKGLVPVVNRPFLEHVIDYFKSYGIASVVFALGHAAEEVQRELGDGESLGMAVYYSVEDEPLGTAGAVRPVERLLKDTFLVYNGDIYTSIPIDRLVALHRRNNAVATLALTPVDDPSQYGVVETDGGGRVRRFLEKPTFGTTSANTINAGIYVLQPEMLELVGPGYTMFETDVFPALIRSGAGVYGHAFDSYWIDIGIPDNYLKLNLAMAEGVVGRAQAGGGAVIGAGTQVAPTARLVSPVVIGPGTEVLTGAEVVKSVLWEGCTIGKGAIVRQSVIADGVVIGADCSVTRCVLGQGVCIPADTVLEDARLPEPR